MLTTRLPIECSRGLRSLNERSHFKANEWRNLAFYVIFPSFITNLNDPYLSNLIKYILFLRLLCQDKINNTHLDDAEILFTNFHKEFEALYGKDKMSFNLHGHTHLVDQVRKHGPLNLISCFPFENVFRITRDMYHGTVNYEGQIGRNLIKRITSKYLIKDVLENTKNHDIKQFIKTHFDKSIVNEDRLICPKKITKIDLKENEISLLNQVDVNQFIYQSYGAEINRQKFFTKEYCYNNNSYNCYTVEIIDDLKEKYYGIITNVLLINNKIFFVVNILEILNNNLLYNSNDLVIKRNLSLFFNLVEETSTHVLCPGSNIIRRCILIKNNNLQIITPFSTQNEHD